MTAGGQDRRRAQEEAIEPSLRMLGERIKAALSQHRIEEVAPRLGVSASAIYNWISGSNEPSLAKLFALASAVRVSPVWLIVGQGTPDSIPGYVKPMSIGGPPPLAFELQWLETNVEAALAPSNDRVLLLLEVPDDSMEPTLKKGDFVLVRSEKTATAPINGIYAIVVKDSALSSKSN